MYTLLEKFWRVSLYVTDGAVWQSSTVGDVKFRHIEENFRKIRHMELSNSVIS